MCILIDPANPNAIGKESKSHLCLSELQISNYSILECAHGFCFDLTSNFCAKLS